MWQSLHKKSARLEKGEAYIDLQQNDVIKLTSTRVRAKT